MNTCTRPEGCTCNPGRIRDTYCSFYVPPPDPLETVQRWTWETDGMERDHDNGPWVRLDDVRRALGVMVDAPVAEVVRRGCDSSGKPWHEAIWRSGIDLPEGTKLYAPGVDVPLAPSTKGGA